VGAVDTDFVAATRGIPMNVLVTYATRHGATRGIAERIGQRLEAAGLQTHVRSVDEVRDTSAYDAMVLGSALYMFHWLGQARSFAKKQSKAMRGKPVWLFSSGPFGDETVDKKGRDVILNAGPKELPELRAELSARDHRVFWGAWDAANEPVGFMEKFTHAMPGAWKAFPAGDKRNWPDIEAWADGIAAELGRG
jgi:menaquinone-dependent protoporphyrinogen oxidase